MLKKKNTTKQSLMFKFSLVATGGTFDRFHKGHEELLKTAFRVSSKVIIGITSDQMVKNKTLSRLILSYNRRRKEIVSFLKKTKLFPRSLIVILHDPYGPLLTNKKIEAVVVGPRVDELVLKNLKGKIKIVKCKIIKSSDERYLSSTRIRKGEVSREGFLYLDQKGPFFLPLKLRERLGRPLGKISTRQTIPLFGRKTIISVGDASTRFLNKNKVKIDLAIVDFKIQRKKVISKFSDLGFPAEKDLSKDYHVTKANNKPGTISSSLIESIKTSLDRLLTNRKREIIKIEGEDDLAVIPVVLYAPLETIVFYGQPGNRSISGKPNEGLVKVVVTEEKKEEMKKILEKFSLSDR